MAPRGQGRGRAVATRERHRTPEEPAGKPDVSRQIRTHPFRADKPRLLPVASLTQHLPFYRPALFLAEAWDALATALIQGGWEMTASWPVHTESEHSLHRAKKNAAQSTILLVCRKRLGEDEGGWWAQVKGEITSRVKQVGVRRRCATRMRASVPAHTNIRLEG